MIEFVEDLQYLKEFKEPRQYTQFRSQLERDVRKNGFVQQDRHLNRETISLPGHFVVIKDKALMHWLRSNDLIPKYKADWMRMLRSFLAATAKAKKDPDSRQLMVFNDDHYSEIHQCFTHMQFVMTGRGEFDLYVYQRSADLVKLKDDLTFFAKVAEAFETEVGKPVTKIVVVYAHVHISAEKEGPSHNQPVQ